MTIGESPNVQRAAESNARGGPAAQNVEQAAKNREIARLIREINEGGGVGPSSELRFSIDPETGQSLIKIVDRVTDEVITQVPPESLLRTAEVLKNLRSDGKLA